MADNLDLYYINLKYIRNISKCDDKVMSISPQRGKEKRPFVGIVTLVNGMEYCIPLTSPKDKFKNKKSSLDLIKIFDKSRLDDNNQYKLIGVLNVNNMIPVNKNLIRKISLSINKDDSYSDKYAKILMQKQLSWCRNHANIIKDRAQKVYNLVVNMPERNKNLTRRSINFKRLEEALVKYNDSQKM